MVYQTNGDRVTSTKTTTKTRPKRNTMRITTLIKRTLTTTNMTKMIESGFPQP